MRFQPTREDILRGKVIEPGWHPVKITAITDGAAGPAAKNPGSLLQKISLTITKGKFAGYPLDCQFSEVAPGFARPFFEALGVKIDEDKPVFPDFQETRGKELEVFVKNSLYNGRNQNNVEDYRPITR